MAAEEVQFGFPNIWQAEYAKYEQVYRAIDRLTAMANRLITEAQSSTDNLTVVLRALTHICITEMHDVLILAGNKRETGAIKLARGMFEIAILSEYLENNPQEVDLYLDFAHVASWRSLQIIERISPGQVPLDLMRDSETEYNRVKDRFVTRGRVRYNWTEKSIKKMAENIGRSDLYDVIYGVASELHHVNIVGLIGHEYDWIAEALRVAQGSLLQTATSLFNVKPHGIDDISSEIRKRIEDFQRVWPKAWPGSK